MKNLQAESENGYLSISGISFYLRQWVSCFTLHTNFMKLIDYAFIASRITEFDIAKRVTQLFEIRIFPIGKAS